MFLHDPILPWHSSHTTVSHTSYGAETWRRNVLTPGVSSRPHSAHLQYSILPIVLEEPPPCVAKARGRGYGYFKRPLRTAAPRTRATTETSKPSRVARSVQFSQQSSHSMTMYASNPAAKPSMAAAA